MTTSVRGFAIGFFGILKTAPLPDGVVSGFVGTDAHKKSPHLKQAWRTGRNGYVRASSS